MATDYSKLDAAILSAIEAKAPVPFHVFAYSGTVASESAALAHTEKNADAWRVVDRRLQAPRKAGRIRYQRKPEGWVLVRREVEIPEAGTNEA